MIIDHILEPLRKTHITSTISRIAHIVTTNAVWLAATLKLQYSSLATQPR